MSRQERKNRQRQLAKLIPPNWNTNDLQEALILYQGTKQGIVPLTPATEDELNLAREEGIIEGMRVYGVEIHSALYDLRETLANINMLSTVSHNNDSRAALAVLESDLINHWGAFDRHVKHLKDAANIETDPEWLNELNINVNDIREAIIAYTSPGIDEKERARREKIFRSVCAKINPALAKAKSIVDNVPVRQRELSQAREYLIHKLESAFHDSEPGALVEAGYRLKEKLEQRPNRSTVEDKVLAWLKKWSTHERFTDELTRLKADYKKRQSRRSPTR